jgi:hypothetical protein
VIQTSDLIAGTVVVVVFVVIPWTLSGLVGGFNVPWKNLDDT